MEATLNGFLRSVLFEMDTWQTKIPTWSALGRLGRSRIASLTILIPFIGWLILFNNQFVEFFRITEAYFSGVSTEEAAAMSRRYTLTKLHFSYFGLLLVAAASAIFAWRCPEIVKLAGNRNAHVSAERKLMTDARRQNLIAQVCGEYLLHHPEEPTIHGPWSGFVTYPYELVNRFSTTLTNIYRSIEHSVFGTDSDPGPFVSALDNVMVDKFAEMLSARRRVERVYWSSADSVLHNFDHDLLTFEYDVPDNSRPKSRLLVFALYLVGLGLLVWPTIETSGRILSGFWK